MEPVITATLWFGAISVGIMAGVYFAFSAFVMRSLDATERLVGMAVMQSINRIIVRSLFLPLFFASSLACVLLVAFGLMQWGSAGAWQMVIGGLLYVIGMLVVTAAANVPLNDALEATDAAGPEAEAMWRRYRQRWVPWNHVRTVSSTLSLALLIGAIAAR